MNTSPLTQRNRERLADAAANPAAPLSPAERVMFGRMRSWGDRDDAALIDAALRGPVPDRPTRARPTRTW